MKKNVIMIMVIILMVTMTMPVAARSWVEGHEAHMENGELFVDGKAVGNVIIPHGDVNAIPVIVVDNDSRISGMCASIDSTLALAVAVINKGGYAIAVEPNMRKAFIGEYDPKEEYFGFMVTDTIEF